MAGRSSIEWTDKTWNPVRGCSMVSTGCENCYAMRLAHRQSGPGQAYEGLTKKTRGHGPVWTGDVREVPDLLEVPLRWKKPAFVFANSMSDLFHDGVSDEFIRQVFDVIRQADWHVFQVLTKRADRLAELAPSLEWPRNLWMGVTVEDEAVLDRVDRLRTVPAALRFLSLEPLLGPLPSLSLEGIGWVIVGGESGLGAREMEEAWVREIRDACVRNGVPFHFKQWGGVRKKKTGRTLDGQTWDERPAREEYATGGAGGQRLKLHPVLDLFPRMAEAEFRELVEDMRVNGQRVPVTVVRIDGQRWLIDGRHRWEAAKELGLRATVSVLNPGGTALSEAEILQTVVALNLHRRHLDESQRGMVAARLATLRDGMKKAAAPIGAAALSQTEAARMLKVGRNTVQRARVVLESGDDALIASVDRGEVAVSTAARQVYDAAAHAAAAEGARAEAVEQQPIELGPVAQPVLTEDELHALRRLEPMQKEHLQALITHLNEARHCLRQAEDALLAEAPAVRAEVAGWWFWRFYDEGDPDRISNKLNDISEAMLALCEDGIVRFV